MISSVATCRRGLTDWTRRAAMLSGSSSLLPERGRRIVTSTFSAVGNRRKSSDWTKNTASLFGLSFPQRRRVDQLSRQHSAPFFTDTSPLQNTASADDGPSPIRNANSDQFSAISIDLMEELGVKNTLETIPPFQRNRAAENEVRRKRRMRPHRRAHASQESRYPVKALHIAQTIDLMKVVNSFMFRSTLSKKLVGKNSLVVRLAQSEEQSELPRYVAIFRFGSVVFLNVSPREVATIVEHVKKSATDPYLSGSERQESFGVLVGEHHFPPPTPHHQGSPQDEILASPPPATSAVVTASYCIVPELDMNGVAVISNIMAQTVALDSYNDTVDDMLANFASINSAVRKTGAFVSTDKSSLYRTVAQNNAIFIDMISKIRLKDRSETAWNSVKYEDLHYKLKGEFEIDDRFDNVEFKLNLIQQNAKFFLEVIQSQKSNSLEWIIVILILVECVLMCIDMSGMGESLYQFFIAGGSLQGALASSPNQQTSRPRVEEDPSEEYR